MATVVEGDQKAPFLIATTTRCRERALLLCLDCCTLTLIRSLYCWVLNKEASSTILKSLVWCDLGLNPGLPDNWWTLYPLDQWGCCLQDFFNTTRSILVWLPSSVFSVRLVNVHMMHLYSSIDTTAVWKNLRFIF